MFQVEAPNVADAFPIVQRDCAAGLRIVDRVGAAATPNRPVAFTALFDKWPAASLTSSFNICTAPANDGVQP